MAIPSQLEQSFVEQHLREVEEYVPDMDPGTIFLLKDQSRLGDQDGDPFIAVLACPRCGITGLITHRQTYNGRMIICGGEKCSAEFRHDGESFIFRKPQ